MRSLSPMPPSPPLFHAPLMSVQDAVDKISAATPRLSTESVATVTARGRVLAAPVRTLHPLPLFDQSAVDGYAVRARDIAADRAVLPVSSMVAAGPNSRPPTLAPATAARVLTGAVLPLGADTIVRQELVEAAGGTVLIKESVSLG